MVSGYASFLLVLLFLLVEYGQTFLHPRSTALPVVTRLQLASTDDAAASTPVTTSKGVDGDQRLDGVKVKSLEGETIDMMDLVQKGTARTVLACLTHFGDFNAWELTQNLQADAEAITSDGTQIVCIGIGNPVAAKKFADDLDLDTSKIQLYADEEGKVAAAMGCYKGWLAPNVEHREQWPASDVNPYVKLFGMIFGFGSPGTISKVLYGYLGDSGAPPSTRKWVVKALLQGGRKGRFPALTEAAFAETPITSSSGLRPFELATLRLQTGLHIVFNWASLGPKQGDMFTRMGGMWIFDASGNLQNNFQHYDKGILTYASRDELLKALQ
mmetsp:Transcript_7553/g.12702  ORF Transcript_7553/g.12702 Transcript_7553/m.12702 type:complete len:328 (+) Transcript_7553:64-1047(+)